MFWPSCVENSSIWTADHDLDVVSQDQIDIYVARGVLVESQGPIWLYGTTSEHNVLYQYQFSNAKNILMAMIQTESPYSQDVPKAPAPFKIGGFSNNPSSYDCSSSSSTCAVSWTVRIIDSEQIHILGAAIREMVSPVKSVATLAKDNQNGFLSSILAWVRNGTVGKRDFPGSNLYNATEDIDNLDGLPEGCKTALTEVVKCDYYAARFRELRYRDVMNKFKTVFDIKDMPRDELCSFYHIEKLRLMQSSAYSTYDEEWKGDLEYVHSTCGLSGPTDVPPPLVVAEPDSPGLCISDEFYTTASSDTCDSIALAHNVASAALYMANSDLCGCDLITAGQELCLPLSCPKTGRLVRVHRMAQNLTLGDVRRYNPWLNLDCPNIHVAAPVLRSVLCLGPQGADITTTAPVTIGPTAAPGPGDGYTAVPVNPPEGAEVAEGNTVRCERWFVTCIGMCVQSGITSALFLKTNPSLNAADCSASLQIGAAYCVGPVYQWNMDPITSMPELTSTAVPRETQSA
ncbi:carbohydrate-binding module family 50 protein [Colletotrichum incanum]|uniref:Carbohydrate-binding module family 50 protein n=1 Tax=Colletotrichum incanum TaxID=1573173 RepID=A0A167CMA4_COLIC|nr:carbohydrate-binding module family 50 protein [Colletotrichum incanum]